MNQSSGTPPLLELLSLAAAADRLRAKVPDDHLLADRADRLLDFALAEYARIAELDAGMGRLALCHADRAGAVAMRRLYQQWADQADDFLRLLRGHGLRERLGAKFEELEAAVGRTLAMLSITLESLERAEEQFRTGQTYTLEEARRELRAAAGG
jgi:hypothetical protein